MSKTKGKKGKKSKQSKQSKTSKQNKQGKQGKKGKQNKQQPVIEPAIELKLYGNKPLPMHVLQSIVAADHSVNVIIASVEKAVEESIWKEKTKPYAKQFVIGSVAKVLE